MSRKKELTTSLILKNGKEIKVSEFLTYKYGLSEGKNSVHNEEKEIFKELLYECGIEAGIKLVTSKERTSEELIFILEKSGFPKDIAVKTAEKLKEYKYLNDVEYIKNFVFSKRYGKERVIYELESKGIKKKIIEEFYRENSWVEDENIEYNISKCKGKTPEQTAGYLARRGFDIEKIVNKIGINNKEG